MTRLLDLPPVIEEHALAISIGEWVIHSALAQIERWQNAGLYLPISVNIGAHQLQQPDFIDRVRAIRKSRLVTVAEGQPAPGEWPACLVANEQYDQFRAMLIHTNPKCERLVLTAAQLDALKCNAGDTVRLVRLCPEEKTA